MKKKNLVNAFISRDEFSKLLEIITPEDKLLNPWLKDAYWMALLTGARKSKISNFKRSDCEKRNLFSKTFDFLKSLAYDLYYKLKTI